MRRYRLSFWLAISVAGLTCSLAFVLTPWHVLGLALDVAGIGLLRSLSHWEVLGMRASWHAFWERRHRY